MAKYFPLKRIIKSSVTQVWYVIFSMAFSNIFVDHYYTLDSLDLSFFIVLKSNAGIRQDILFNEKIVKFKKQLKIKKSLKNKFKLEYFISFFRRHGFRLDLITRLLRNYLKIDKIVNILQINELLIASSY